uniref:ATP synthase subunit a n=1 Tax=Pristaulacus compressus TaxID=1414807 RepID=U5TX72_9HYME|nr:ATP synthase F0 subunit 6 [Pristaulacus compressus]AGZ13115.1 ATP synthase FO subunit 6 [Pristaulacus compressus]
MMNNLFSIFDPTTSNLFSFNWLSSLIFLYFLPLKYWMKNSRNFLFCKKLFFFIENEFKSILLNKINLINLLLFLSTFFFILFNNLLGLFPYIFTSSSHLKFSFNFSLTLWMCLIMFGFINFFFNMLFHFVPQNTPFILSPFMVLIESIKNLIRPLTLSIRLSANMIAGHLLITLISESLEFIKFIMLYFPFLFQLILMILEIAVSIIQSYVFSILIILYSKEIN